MKLRVLLFETPEDPYMNLAFEEAIPRARGCGISPDTLRLWRNQGAVIIGYFQRAEEEVNLEQADRLGIKVVRRFTGGGAAYHDLGNINYALSLSLSERRVANPLEYIFSELIKAPVEALRGLGFNASLENVNDIVVDGRKVSGTAATVAWGSIFFHGAMLVNSDLSRLASVLRVSVKKLIDKGISSVKYRVTNLSSIKNVSVQEVADSLANSFAKLLGYDGVRYEMPSSEELEIANVLYNYKYTSKEWNFERASHKSFATAEAEISKICRS